MKWLGCQLWPSAMTWTQYLETLWWKIQNIHYHHDFPFLIDYSLISVDTLIALSHIDSKRESVMHEEQSQSHSYLLANIRSCDLPFFQPSLCLIYRNTTINIQVSKQTLNTTSSITYVQLIQIAPALKHFSPTLPTSLKRFHFDV
jgi:hypothetical protein